MQDDGKSARELFYSLTTIDHATVPKLGQDWLESFCKTVIQVLNVDIAIIGTFNADRTRVQSFCSVVGRKRISNFEYDLAGTPCEYTLNENGYYCEDRVQEKYPHDQDLVDMVKVAAIAQEAIVYLAERPEPLTKSGTLGQGQPVQVSSGRKVTTGSTPDFAFSGSGIKLTDVAEGSPAAAAGLAAGDVVTHLGGEEVADLRKYTTVLATFEPGQTVDVVYDRNGQEMKTQMTLVAR